MNITDGAEMIINSRSLSVWMVWPRDSKNGCFIAEAAEILFFASYCKKKHNT